MGLTGFLLAMLSHDFIRSAFEAGAVIALAAGPVGYFLVLRGQIFAADALGHVAFTGALAALVLGFDLAAGLVVSTVGVGAGMAQLSGRKRSNDVVIGSVFAWTLGLGVLFLTLYTTYGGASNGAAGVTVLFGSIFGLRSSQVGLAIAICLPVTALALLIARPLLFASVDPEAAAAQQIPVRAVGLIFMLLVALVVAEAAQAIGALLIVGLLAMPPMVAQRLTNCPFAALLLSPVIGVAGIWAGLTLSYAVNQLPPSFAIVAVLFVLFIVSQVIPGSGRRLPVAQAPSLPG
jgi:zinc/manganese transport system permease protein